MPKSPAKEKSATPMSDAQRLERGRAVDELQSRIADLKRLGKAVPEEWQTRLAELADTQDKDILDKHLEWASGTLPPKEYMVDEITWDTFTHFSSALLDQLTLFASRKLILSGTPDAAARALMVEILAIKRATDSPIIAMTELAKCRARANTLTDEASA